VRNPQFGGLKMQRLDQRSLAERIVARALAGTEPTSLPRAFHVVVGSQRLHLCGIATSEEAIAIVEQHLHGIGRPLTPPLPNPPPTDKLI
jgi:hypothetical protein